MSYWDTALALPFASEGVPGLPAYTVPAWPPGLNTEPGALAELPGVELVAAELKHVVPGAPGWPGPLGLVSANAVAGIATAMPATAIAASSLLIGPPLDVPVSFLSKYGLIDRVPTIVDFETQESGSAATTWMKPDWGEQCRIALDRPSLPHE
jgi:hypothetical protein